MTLTDIMPERTTQTAMSELDHVVKLNEVFNPFVDLYAEGLPIPEELFQKLHGVLKNRFAQEFTPDLSRSKEYQMFGERVGTCASYLLDRLGHKAPEVDPITHTKAVEMYIALNPDTDLDLDLPECAATYINELIARAIAGKSEASLSVEE